MGGNNDERKEFRKSFQVGSGFGNICSFCLFHALSHAAAGETVHDCLLGYSFAQLPACQIWILLEQIPWSKRIMRASVGRVPTTPVLSDGL